MEMVTLRTGDKHHAEAAETIIRSKFKHADPMVHTDDGEWAVSFAADYTEQAQRALKEAGKALIEMSEQ